MRRGDGARAIRRREAGGERLQRGAMGLRAARTAAKARHGDFVEFDEDAGVGFKRTGGVEFEGGKRRGKIATEGLEAPNVAGDQGPPLTGVATRQRGGPTLFEAGAVAFAQAVENDGPGPLQQASQGFVSVGRRQHSHPCERGHSESRPDRSWSAPPVIGGGMLCTALKARNTRCRAYSVHDDARLTRGAQTAAPRATSRSASSSSASR